MKKILIVSVPTGVEAAVDGLLKGLDPEVVKNNIVVIEFTTKFLFLKEVKKDYGYIIVDGDLKSLFTEDVCTEARELAYKLEMRTCFFTFRKNLHYRGVAFMGENIDLSRRLLVEFLKD